MIVASFCFCKIVLYDSKKAKNFMKLLIEAIDLNIEYQINRKIHGRGDKEIYGAVCGMVIFVSLIMWMRRELIWCY